ncbi:MAG: type II toxin-antitoxin system VapC family toxin [Candidatus Micrarchaeota archaeon]
MILIVDSWAWLATGEEGRHADESIELISNKKNEILTTMLNIYEVYYRVTQAYGEEKARKFIESIKQRARIVEVDEELTFLAANLHLKEKLSVIDAFVYATALKENGQVLTGDPHFKGKEMVIFIE